MKELLPHLLPLKGDFGTYQSLVNTIYNRDDIQIGGPTIRFSLAIGNVGEGPLHLEIYDTRKEDGKIIASAKQRIYNEKGQFREIPVDNVIRTPHDPSHQSWHYEKLASFFLTDINGKVLSPGKKAEYCVVDNYPMPNELLKKYSVKNPAKESIFKPEEGCLPEKGGAIGISVGWSDTYIRNQGDMYIPISNIPTGIYILQLQVNKTKIVDSNNGSAAVAQHRIKIDKENHRVMAADDIA